MAISRKGSAEGYAEERRGCSWSGCYPPRTSAPASARLCGNLPPRKSPATAALTPTQARAYAELLKLRVPAARALLGTENPASSWHLVGC